MAIWTRRLVLHSMFMPWDGVREKEWVTDLSFGGQVDICHIFDTCQIGFRGMEKPSYWRIMYYTFCHLFSDKRTVPVDNYNNYSEWAGASFSLNSDQISNLRMPMLMDVQPCSRTDDYDRSRDFMTQLLHYTLCHLPFLSYFKTWSRSSDAGTIHALAEGELIFTNGSGFNTLWW